MARQMRRIRLPLGHARGTARPVLEFVPSGSREHNENDYFWIGELKGECFAFVDAEEFLALADEVREMQAEVRGVPA